MSCVVSFPDYQAQAQQLAAALQQRYARIELHHFPDGESLLQLPEPLDKQLIIYRSLEQPNDKLVELLLVSKAARAVGVEKITLVAPYLCYMRQDKAFHRGEVISQKIIANFLAELVDVIITVDPHLHRVASLQEVFPHIQSSSLSASELLGEFLQQNFRDVILLGPDDESVQWVRQIARLGNYHYAVASKTRYSDTEVKIHLPDIDVSDQHVVLVDDIISTGHTVAETAQLLIQRGATRVDVLVTHALFSEDALTTLRAAGIQQIWSSDSVNHASNHIALTPLLATTLKSM